MKYERTAWPEEVPAAIKLPAIANKAISKRSNHKPVFPTDQDIILWLSKNAPSNFDELIEIRYSLYHRCNGGGYRVKRLDDEELRIAGRNGSLHIISNQARRFLLTKLRELAKESGWRGALPKIRPARTVLQPKPTNIC
ncbi:hypothetical protein JQ631_30025 [Bradyrhizobium manausense]|uniref:hypothetical protein n=1 Tax=Bradyrhizobium manausense TaxID=989370 RepID=UPI001BAD2116|nr:hypothetical protein [Bradyrhizobium manausense]MBR0793336.1 hypothetical protein [Bradyrhizobium manausense]